MSHIATCWCCNLLLCMLHVFSTCTVCMLLTMVHMHCMLYCIPCVLYPAYCTLHGMCCIQYCLDMHQGQSKHNVPKAFFAGASYVDGFGDPDGEHWLGLKNIHCLTSRVECTELRVGLTDFEGVKKFASYRFFSVGNAGTKYRLNVGGYVGTAGDALTTHNGTAFSTFDQDNDLRKEDSCAVLYKGAWWYRSCHESNLNGQYLSGSHTSYADGVNWYPFKGHHYSLKYSAMKIRAA